MREMVQVRITAPGKHFIPEGYVRLGQVLWVSLERAKVLINDQHLAEPAATESKPAGPAKKKVSAGDDPASLSTDSQKLPETGTVAPSSVSQPDRLSAGSKSEPSKKRGRPKKSAS